jgi:hypothetical protein
MKQLGTGWARGLHDAPKHVKDGSNIAPVASSTARPTRNAVLPPWQSGKSLRARLGFALKMHLHRA